VTVCETVCTTPSAPVLRSVGVGAEDGEAEVGVKAGEEGALDNELGEEDNDKDEGSADADAELDPDADKESDPVGPVGKMGEMPGMVIPGIESVGKLKVGKIPIPPAAGVGSEPPSRPVRAPPRKAMDKGIKGKVLKKVGVEKGLKQDCS